MSAPIVSATMGVMNPLIRKLAALMGDEYKKLTSVRKQASFLKDELGTMKALLEKLELMDKLDPLAKNWRDHVREMSYDMEDCVDDFVRQFGGGHAKVGFIRKTAGRLKRLGKRHQIANRIEELRVLVQEASERRMRYKIDDFVNSSSGAVAVDPRMAAIYKDAAGLVGIDGPKEELVSWLTGSEKYLKIVSIVGFGGLGKTTLAKQVYDEIGGQFSCKAFVSVSQRPNMRGLLGGLQLKLGMEEESSAAREVQDIIDHLREHLTHKRYLIVIDDLWDQSTWNSISCAFPDNSIGSRVLVTTRVEDVAHGACCNRLECIYRMKPLKEQDSRILFNNRVFGSEDGCPSQFKEVSAEILEKCGGLPLAIITIASLLASRQAILKDEWESIKNSMAAKVATNPTLEEMRSILNLSYMHLPLHLRSCLLYIGMYPEDHEIPMVDLVRQWIAEGLVSRSHGSDLHAVAKSYFNELINRSLIQPAITPGFGEVMSCRVHDMMLDLIQSKCAEDNFISVAYNCEDIARMHGSEYKVRRLSLKSSACSETSGSIDTIMSQVRSFACFGESKCTPPLFLFKYLRVMIFQFSSEMDTTIDLTTISQLFHLRYLNVYTETCIIDLPTEIRGLVHLETLEIHGRSVKPIPSDIVFLPQLSRLTLPYGRGLPNGIEKIKSLRALYCFDRENTSLKDIEGIGQLTDMKELKFNGKMEADAVDALVSSIGRLRDLRYLSIHGGSPKHYCESMYLLPNPPLHLEELYLPAWLLKKIPKWIGDLHCLRIMCLSVVHLLTQDVLVIGKLPSLVRLVLWVSHITKDGPAIIGKGSFPVLERLSLNSEDGDAMACIKFEAGAMPNLRELSPGIHHGWGGVVPLGMEHLLALEHIDVYLISSVHKRLDVETAFRSAADVHPRHPSVTVGP